MTARTIAALLAAGTLAGTAAADDDFERRAQERYEACVELTRIDAETAFEDAIIWRGEGGGAAARHCAALALLNLGKVEEAAARLEATAFMPDGGDAAMRAEILGQAGNAWLLARAPEDAEQAFSQALELNPGSADLLIDRARARALQSEFEAAVADLDGALERRPHDPLALRLRADAYLKLGLLDRAEDDVAHALESAPDDIEVLLIRGRVREARRLSGATG